MPSILEALTGLSNPQNFAPQNPSAPFDPSNGLAGLSQEDIVALLLSGKLRLEDLQQLPNNNPFQPPQIQTLPNDPSKPPQFQLLGGGPVGQGVSAVPTATPIPQATARPPTVTPPIATPPPEPQPPTGPLSNRPLPTPAPTSTPFGQLEPGNIDLHNRPVVQNPDGTYSTVRSMSIGTPQGEILIPTISDDGKRLSNEQAIEQYRRTGKHLGVFESSDAATLYGKNLSAAQEKEYGGKLPENWTVGDLVRYGANKVGEYLPSPRAMWDIATGPGLGGVGAQAAGSPPPPELVRARTAPPWQGNPDVPGKPRRWRSTGGGWGESPTGAGWAEGGSSPVPPEERPYSEAGTIDTSTPVGKVVADVTRQGPPPLGTINVTDPPKMPPLVYPKDEMSPYDAGIGEPPESHAAAPAQVTASGGLSQLKNMLMGFHPSTPAGQALMAFGFANASPGGNFGDAGLQALQTYTSAQNARAEEQLRRDQMAASRAERLEQRRFDWAREGRADVRATRAAEHEGNIAAWQARTTAGQHQWDVEARRAEAAAARRHEAEKWVKERAAEKAERRTRVKEARARASGVTQRAVLKEQGKFAAKFLPQIVNTGKGIYEVTLDPRGGPPRSRTIVAGSGAGGADSSQMQAWVHQKAAALEAEAGGPDAGFAPEMRAYAGQLRNIADAAKNGGLDSKWLAEQYQKVANEAAKYGVQMPSEGGEGQAQGQAQPGEDVSQILDAKDFAQISEALDQQVPEQEVIADLTQEFVAAGNPPDVARRMAEQAVLVAGQIRDVES